MNEAEMLTILATVERQQTVFQLFTYLQIWVEVALETLYTGGRHSLNMYGAETVSIGAKNAIWHSGGVCFQEEMCPKL